MTSFILPVGLSLPAHAGAGPLLTMAAAASAAAAAAGIAGSLVPPSGLLVVVVTVIVVVTEVVKSFFLGDTAVGLVGTGDADLLRRPILA